MPDLCYVPECQEMGEHSLTIDSVIPSITVMLCGECYEKVPEDQKTTESDSEMPIEPMGEFHGNTVALAKKMGLTGWLLDLIDWEKDLYTPPPQAHEAPANVRGAVMMHLQLICSDTYIAELQDIEAYIEAYGVERPESCDSAQWEKDAEELKQNICRWVEDKFDSQGRLRPLPYKAEGENMPLF